MKRLVVLVGLPGSGKTSFREGHPEWAAVSKDDIRRTVFHRDFDLDYEDAVERIFSVALVEAVQSPAQVVCVDNTDITRAERQPLIEVACLSDREPVAHVMPLLPLEMMYERKQQQLEDLVHDYAGLKVSGFPKDRYEAMYNRYEAVSEDEGFSRITNEVPLLSPLRGTKRTRRARRKRIRRVDELKPLPLFAQ